ncbi:hypothetical protein C1637_16795 [Chryseobacterium lactis]|uniref:Uncharacterized protein n=1 Tax=Chryseobacterium lactis TaxID=1241981 RepID=A0A3G6RHL2_CHRLC|nr:hypothetical protein [Chryseobacterium lactis]AZA84146.1 hypothetical protein EG342_20635 [Chryseobacterium lactis]AZB04532.1 hypothetical protein EG341_11510 [Chryseobacterium lactis]PNW12701.1 hypothetical protein C1637_16795 [Chryseobacterium lactis]
MAFIDYSNESKRIYVLEDRTISVFDKDIKLTDEIKLDFNAHFIEKTTFFKYLEKVHSFEMAGCDSENIYYFKFDGSGNLVSQELLSQDKKDILLRLNDQNKIEQLFFDQHSSYHSNCKIFKNHQEILQVNLLDQCENEEKDWVGYEYMECLKSTNQPGQLAFIATHATYGVQGVKVFGINDSQQLDMVYDMDDLDYDGAFHNLAFNATGEKFTVLLYENDDDLNDSFSIFEYSVHNNISPLKIHKTNHGFLNFHRLHTHYLTDSILCIVRNSDIIIFDLNNGKTIDTLNRDFKSSFFIDFNILIYQLNDKIIVLEY